MTKWWRVVLLGCIAIVCCDALASVASLRVGFDYAKAGWGSDVVYLLISFLASRATGTIRHGAAAAAIAGIAEATLGWWVSWQIGPGQVPGGEVSTFQMLSALVMVPSMAALIGAVGGWVGSLRRGAPDRGFEKDGGR